MSSFEKKHLPQPDALYVLNPHKTVVGDTRIIIVSELFSLSAIHPCCASERPTDCGGLMKAELALAVQRRLYGSDRAAGAPDC